MKLSLLDLQLETARVVRWEERQYIGTFCGCCGWFWFVVFTTIHCFFFLSEETFGLHIYSVEGGYLFYKE